MSDEVSVNYLRIGDRTYAVKEIEGQAIDINEELKEMYEGRLRTHSEQYNEGVVDNAVQEWNVQYEHINRARERGEVKVPDNMFEKTVIVRQGRLMECKTILYAPTQFLGSMQLFSNVCRWGDRVNAMFTALNVDRGTECYFMVKPTVHYAMVVAYDPTGRRLYTTNMRGFHSYSDGRICTGNHSAADFWNANNFSELMNQINWHSPASQEIVCQGRSTVTLANVLNNNTLTDIIMREGEGSWRTQA